MKKLLFALLLIPTLATAATLSGEATNINDGDKFKIWGQTIRLIGIDTVENAQTCKNPQGVDYPCGDFATNYLKEFVRGQEVICKGDPKDADKQLLPIC